ncbi:unnamed protein product [Echinostoma caproni]|uniref:Proteoglycan 4-like n=1 Tax=Echinostoma caproni TaxID=27848 RepID=A0A183A8F9_9TREM|nr:unnamed protein product [Echinostoma caproni]
MKLPQTDSSRIQKEDAERVTESKAGSDITVKTEDSTTLPKTEELPTEPIEINEQTDQPTDLKTTESGSESKPGKAEPPLVIRPPKPTTTPTAEPQRPIVQVNRPEPMQHSTNKSVILVQNVISPQTNVSYPHPFRPVGSSIPHSIGTQFRPVDITQTKVGQETLRRNPLIRDDQTGGRTRESPSDTIRTLKKICLIFDEHIFWHSSCSNELVFRKHLSQYFS